MPHSGACLCGQTTVELTSTHEGQIICHCTDCKQTSGSAYSTNVLAPKTDVKIEGPVKRYGVKVPSGNVVTRIFCGNCGSAVSHESVVFGEAQAIQTGNFKDFASVPVVAELFTKDRWTGLAPVAGAAQHEKMPA